MSVTASPAAIPVVDQASLAALGDFEASWLEHCAERNRLEKITLADYIITHGYITFGDHLLIGSGSTLNTLIDRLFEYQIEHRTSLELSLVSISMHVLERGVQLKHAYPNLFLNTQLSLTGGTIQPGLHALMGAVAIAGIMSSVFNPHQVYFGAVAVCFGPGAEISLHYEFDTELSTQAAIAGRANVDHKFLLFTPDKFGQRRGWRADISIDTLMRGARMCSFVSLLPDAGDPHRKIVLQQVEVFSQLLDSLVAGDQYSDQDLRLILLNATGEEQVHLSLSQRRAQRRPSVIVAPAVHVNGHSGRAITKA